MKKIISSVLLLLSLQSFAQVTGNTVTNITVKMQNVNTLFQKFKDAEWKMVQNGADGSKTEIRGFNVVSADANSITLEQKEFGANLKVNFATKVVTALENGKPSAQKILFVSANADPVELEQADLIEIDETAKGTTVSSIKWKNELVNQETVLNKISATEWEYAHEAINMKESFPKEDKKFKQVAADNNSVTLEEINPDPSNKIFYATKIKIDIVAKVVYKAVYEADVKKWTALEKEDIGTNVFLVIK